ncbi:MAG: NUDIX hydrolase [Pseudonocardiaceae bacterium]
MKLIDIFNDRYEPIGTEDKKSAHTKGLWHRTFSALAINPASKRVVLQKKAPGRYIFDRPDYADITVGGHYQAGETIPDGVREVHEELGLPVAYRDLHPIGLTTSNSTSSTSACSSQRVVSALANAHTCSGNDPGEPACADRRRRGHPPRSHQSSPPSPSSSAGKRSSFTPASTSALACPGTSRRM